MEEVPQRQRKRFRVSLPVRIWPRARQSASKLVQGINYTFTENISAKGCYFHLPRALAVGSEIEMEIELPASEPIPLGLRLRCRATVVRVETSREEEEVGIGCEINDYWFAQPGTRLRKIRVA